MLLYFAISISFHLISHFHSGDESFQTGLCVVAPTLIDVLLCSKKDVIEKEKVFFLVPVTKQFVRVGEGINVEIKILEP